MKKAISYKQAQKAVYKSGGKVKKAAAGDVVPAKSPYQRLRIKQTGGNPDAKPEIKTHATKEQYEQHRLNQQGNASYDTKGKAFFKATPEEYATHRSKQAGNAAKNGGKISKASHGGTLKPVQGTKNVGKNIGKCKGGC